MADNMTRHQRSLTMSRIRSRDTKPETLLRSALHRRGLRFRVNCNTLPGCPDIVFARCRVVVFVDGDFWHGYKLADWAHKLGGYWREKITNNRQRDVRINRRLRRLGWSVIRVWEHEVEDDLAKAIRKVEASIQRRLRM